MTKVVFKIMKNLPKKRLSCPMHKFKNDPKLQEEEEEYEAVFEG